MTYSNDFLYKLSSEFDVEGTIDEVMAFGDGLINDTFIVRTKGSTPNYLMQRKNHLIFPDVAGMMDNIYKVTTHMRNKIIATGGDPFREVLTVTKTKVGGRLVTRDEQGNYWTMCLFIEGSKTYDKATTPALAYKGGAGIGRFQALLSDYTEPLNEVIKGFHNIRFRFEQWDATIKADRVGRMAELAEQIDWIESRREKMLAFWKMVEDGTLPMRVTHNDTKLANILFDNNTDEVLCMIDLDTCMSSTSLNDVGDALRSYTNTGDEDDKDLSRVTMSREMYDAFIEGYLSERRSTLTPSETEYLPFSGMYITYEQVLRFLMDYIDGDRYYKIAYPEHNLVRTKAQYALLQSMEKQLI